MAHWLNELSFLFYVWLIKGIKKKKNTKGLRPNLYLHKKKLKKESFNVLLSLALTSSPGKRKS